MGTVFFLSNAVLLQKYTLVHISTCVFSKCICNLACRVAHFLQVMWDQVCLVGTKLYTLIHFFSAIHFRSCKLFICFCHFIKSENECVVGTWPRAMFPQLYLVSNFHKHICNLKMKKMFISFKKHRKEQDRNLCKHYNLS